MKWFLDWKRKIRNGANCLQRWGVYRCYVRRRRLAVHGERLNEEARLAGEKLYAKTELFAQIDEVSHLPVTLHTATYSSIHLSSLRAIVGICIVL
jgi:hypothetical protein